MTKLTTEITIEELQYRINAHENDLTQMWTADYLLNVQKELLALKQAAKNPVASCWSKGGILQRDQFIRYDVSSFPDGEIKLFAAPVLPKQPESRNEIMANGVEAFAKDWKGSARYSRISEMACNFAAKLRNGDADEC
ncbi:hypothetical protein MUN35_10715 [Hafnia paralvei]|uniref:hypothetical protein n=1 Tax=Hafnia paralvei TaxID=546367 RepID=UPI001FFF6BE7|nr:hypothetical protein [Hafnia paralvei]MCK2180172.1 hypothetical protein [Hafnia paralvei]